MSGIVIVLTVMGVAGIAAFFLFVLVVGTPLLKEEKRRRSLLEQGARTQ